MVEARGRDEGDWRRDMTPDEKQLRLTNAKIYERAYRNGFKDGLAVALAVVAIVGYAIKMVAFDQ